MKKREKALFDSNVERIKELERKLAEAERVCRQKSDIIALQELDIQKQSDLLKKQRETIDSVRSYLVENRLMKTKLINQLFGRSSAKTKNLIAEELKKDTAPDAPLRKEKDTASARRGRTSGKQNFDGWKAGSFVHEEKTVDVGDLVRKSCGSCGKDEWVVTGYDEVVKISLIPQRIRRTKYRFPILQCPCCGDKVRTYADQDCFGRLSCTPSLAGFLSMLSCGLYLPYKRIEDYFGYAGTPLSRELITKYCMVTGNLLKDFVGGTTEDGETYEGLVSSGYEGTIVTDSYGAYMCDMVHSLCWSHLRKYVFDYLQANRNPDNRDYQEMKALLDRINAIFALEREFGGLPPEEKIKARKERLKPLIEEYFAMARNAYDPKKDDMKNRAIGYGLRNEKLYMTLIEKAGVPLTNNRAESSMRKYVMKRVSSLFSASTEGMKATCVLLTLVQSARMNRLQPDAYVQYLLENLGSLKDRKLAKDYLPWSRSIPDRIRIDEEEYRKAEREVDEEMNTKRK